MSKFVVLVLGVDAFLKEKLEKAPTDEWRPLFVHNFDEAMRVMKHTPASCLVAGPYIKDKNGAKRIAQFCRQFETVPAILYDGRLQVLDLSEEIAAAIKCHAFQPEVKIFGINLEQCSKRIKQTIRMMMEEFCENITVDEIARRLGVHRSHLERDWHQECGSITAKQLLIGLKLHYSTFLMRNEGLKLKDIACLAGFANEHEFYRSFHRHTAPQFGYTGIHSTNLGTASFLPFTISVGGGERMRILTNGNIGIGTTSPGTRLHVAGTTRTNIVEITGGTDLAESFEIANSKSCKPGMVVCIDPEQPGQLRIANKAYDRTVAGIVSGAGGINSGIMLKKSDSEADGECPVALSGRVYCWTDASNGSIQPGDLLTTSEMAGHAMKVTDYTKAQGAIIGKAMSTLEKGRGLVLILVTLQ